MIASHQPETFDHIGSVYPGRVLNEARKIRTRERQERLKKRERQRARILRTNHPLGGEQYRLLRGDFRKVWQTIKPGSVDLILTDPPWPRQYLPLYGQLSEVASRLLKPGGICLIGSGIVSLPEVLHLLSKHLNYNGILTHGPLAKAVEVNEFKIWQKWNPHIFFVNGPNQWEWVDDWIPPYKPDKRFHEWGKSVAVMAHLIDRFSVEGYTVLDPFMGAGTTGVAAVNLRRLFIGIDLDPYCVKTTAKRLADQEGLPDDYTPLKRFKPQAVP